MCKLLDCILPIQLLLVPRDTAGHDGARVYPCVTIRTERYQIVRVVVRVVFIYVMDNSRWMLTHATEMPYRDEKWVRDRRGDRLSRHFAPCETTKRSTNVLCEIARTIQTIHVVQPP